MNKLLLISLVALSACATPELPASSLGPVPLQWSTKLQSQHPVDTEAWWREFGEPDLDRTVERALAHNHDLAAADANLRAALALAREAHASGLPFGGVSAGTQRLRQSAAEQPPMTGAPERFATQSVTSVGAALSWELDVVGALAAGRRKAEAQAAESLWLRRQAEAAVAAATVRAWTDYHATAALEDIAITRLAALREALDRLSRAEALGGAPRAEVETARARLELLQSELPGLGLQKRNAARRLAVLAGRTPQSGVEARERLEHPTPVSAPSTLGIADPAATLRLRPDVRAAEQRFQAALAQTQIEFGQLYPRISLEGNAGLSGPFSSLDQTGAVQFGIGPRLTWGIFDLARTQARIAASGAAAEAALRTWESTVLLALEEADGAVDAWSAARVATQSAIRARDATNAAVRILEMRAERGLASPLELARSESDRLVAEAVASQAHWAEARAWIDANLALGNSWRDGGAQMDSVGAPDSVQQGAVEMHYLGTK